MCVVPRSTATPHAAAAACAAAEGGSTRRRAGQQPGVQIPPIGRPADVNDPDVQVAIGDQLAGEPCVALELLGGKQQAFVLRRGRDVSRLDLDHAQAASAVRPATGTNPDGGGIEHSPHGCPRCTGHLAGQLVGRDGEFRHVFTRSRGLHRPWRRYSPAGTRAGFRNRKKGQSPRAARTRATGFGPRFRCRPDCPRRRSTT